MGMVYEWGKKKEQEGETVTATVLRETVPPKEVIAKVVVDESQPPMPQKVKAIVRTQDGDDMEEEFSTKRNAVTYGCRMDEDIVNQWKSYTSVLEYGSMGHLTEQALHEYMHNHPLTEEQEGERQKVLEAIKIASSKRKKRKI